MPPKRKRQSPCAVYDFTYSKEAFDKKFKDRDAFEKVLQQWFKMWAYQLEEGENGFIHYQGRGSLIRQQRLSSMIKTVNEIFPGSHFSITSKDVALAGELFYVIKHDTRIKGPWTSEKKAMQLHIPTRYRVKPNKWQQRVINSGNFPDYRSINVICDPKGGLGKTTLTYYIHFYKKGYSIPVTHNPMKIIEFVADKFIALQEKDPKLLLFDIPRSFPKRRLWPLFENIEKIKDCLVWDGRYHSREWSYESPSVWVFCNKQINVNMLSRDRWRFWEYCPKEEDIIRIPTPETADEPTEPPEKKVKE